MLKKFSNRNLGPAPISHGFTLIELLIVLCVLALIIAGTFQTMVQFRKAFDSGEQNTEMMREVSRFLEYLRKDLHNAVPPLDTPGTTFEQAVKCTAGELAFPTFVDDNGGVSLVSYVVAGTSVQRTLGSGAPQTLITDSLASLTWAANDDGCNRCSSFQAGRMWIHLDALFGKFDANDKLTKQFQLSTNLFPVRWNRMVQRNPRVSAGTVFQNR